MSARGVAARRSRVRLTARTWILAVVVTVLLISAVFPLRTYLSERTQVARLARQMQVIDAKNLELHGRIKHLHDRGYLERLARECLGMVLPGEVSFVVVPKGGGPKPASC